MFDVYCPQDRSRILLFSGDIEENREAYYELVEAEGAKSIFVFAPESHEEGNDLAARMFADYFGIPEDPATGSAAGCLAGYLVAHRYLDADSIDVRVEQGYEIGRPSLLYLRAQRREDREPVCRPV